MNAFQIINSFVSDILLDKSYKQVSSVMYDEKLLNNKVSIIIFQENKRGHLIRKFKIIVEDLIVSFKITTEEIPLALSY
jgi:hypothetical protein